MLKRALKFSLFALSVLSCQAFGAQGGEEVNAYIKGWLEKHHAAHIVADASGVALPDRQLRFSGDIYSAQQNGKLFIVETQLRVALPGGRALEENVVGAGSDAQSAFLQSLTNLCESTLEPLYAEFVGEKDEFVMSSKVRFGEKERTVFQTGWSRRGDEPTNDDGMAALKTQMFATMSALKLDSRAHWGKLVLLSAKGQVQKADLTIDNQEQPVIAQSIKAMAWPKTSNFYMLKLFFVVHADRS